MTVIEFILRYNFDRPEIEILLDLIYIQNQDYRLEPHVVKFPSDPVVLDIRPEILDDENTFIAAVVDKNYDYRLDPANTGFLYRRLPLAALKNSTGTTIIPPALPFKTYDILDQINQQLGSQLTENDLENIEYTTSEEIGTIVAKPTSKIWLGWREIDIDGFGALKQFFDQKFLDGFIPWSPPTP
jgi:hypothetical protein